ncbi:multidrug effflux MFS transporter [Arthrobacter tumbae]|uniref:multidrug effflux MFS transporter n=1 Tax=Arthrobacter tumbae TaxID=163874 RepID=UPI00195AC9A8|nr:multidrug effflux MFS transporter [Arthrobacter tumbae]MBM7782209.1 DHA1 family bicyclomycin/chloramphenicol resistance-like MFS transporter [Arthrobacter tumbae]
MNQAQSSPAITEADSSPPQARPRVLILVAALAMLQVIWPLTMDLYLPAFPAIRREFGVPESAVQLTLTAAFIGMGIGQLTSGPVSDAVGRARPLAVMIVVYCLATVSCALAPSMEWLIASRAFQGMGSAACAVIALAIVRDLYTGKQLMIILARLAIVSGVFVVASPALGAQLMQVVGWRGLFWILLAYGLVLLCVAGAILLRNETNPLERRLQRKGVRLTDDYRSLIADGRFRSVALAGGLLFSAMMSFMAGSAFLIQEVYGLSPTGYALLFGAQGALMVIGAQIGGFIARRTSPVLVVRIGAVALVVAASVLLLSVSLAPQLGVWGLMAPIMGFTTAFGLATPALQATALEHHGLRAGTAASLLGASNMTGAAIIAPVTGAFGLSSPVPTAVVMLCCAAGAAVLLLPGVRERAHMPSQR